MKKTGAFLFGIPVHWLGIAALPILVLLGSWAISTGKYKTIAVLLLPGLVLAFRAASERAKFWLLALSIPLSVMNIPTLKLPYGTSIAETILVGLALDEILFPHGDHTLNRKPLKLVVLISFGLFVVAGLVANLGRVGIASWNAYCLTPLLAFFVISRKVYGLEQAWLLVKLSLLTIVGFIAIVQWAIATGRFEIYDPLLTELGGRYYRMADGMIISLGPIRITAFATRMGAIAALGFPACVLLWMEEKGKLWWRAILLLIMAALGYALIMSATRGSVLAAIAGSVLVILVSGRLRSPIFLGSLALSLMVLATFGGTILGLLPGKNVWRLLTLLQGVQSIPNYHQRMDVLALAWRLTLQNPLGVGFGYLFHTYRLDDAIIYAVILQGTGILGAIAFIMIVGQLALQLGWGVMKSHQQPVRDLASIGLGTLAAGLLAGVSSQSILFEPVHAYVFWVLMLVCFCAVVRRPRFVS